MRLAVDQWGKVEACEDASFDAKVGELTASASAAAGQSVLLLPGTAVSSSASQLQGRFCLQQGQDYVFCANLATLCTKHGELLVLGLGYALLQSGVGHSDASQYSSITALCVAWPPQCNMLPLRPHERVRCGSQAQLRRLFTILGLA
jgi:hypothetical protein